MPGLQPNLLQRILYSPSSVHIVVCRRCNLSCGYCNEYDKVSEPVDADVLKRRIDKLQSLGALSVAFTGGEPLLHPGIPELVRYARRRMPGVGLITNGYLLTASLTEALNEAKLSWLQISIDGLEPNEVTVKALKPMRRKLEMLADRARFRININSVIGATNPLEALGVVRFARRMGFPTTIGLVHDGTGKLELDRDQVRAYHQVDALRKRPFWDLYNFEKEFIEKGESDFKCRAGSRYLYVDEFGTAHYCSQQRELYGKPLEEMTHEDLRSNFYSRKPCSNGCTIGCVRRASWLDSWRR